MKRQPRQLIIDASLLLALLCGCSQNPYRDRPIELPSGETRNFAFAYGKFCGGGYPPPDQTDRSEQLLGAWPPVDELDAICYAPDHCYSATRNHDVSCDSAFHSMIIEAGTRFGARGCWNLTTDMVIAFFFKNWGQGGDASETGAHRFTQTVLGIPTAAFWAVLKLPIRPFLKYPKEGSCSSGEEAGICRTLRQFEEEYSTALFADTENPVRVPDHCTAEDRSKGIQEFEPAAEPAVEAEVDPGQPATRNTPTEDA